MSSIFVKDQAAGVAFRTPPTEAGTTIFAVLDDTCGNYIQLNQA